MCVGVCTTHARLCGRRSHLLSRGVRVGLGSPQRKRVCYFQALCCGCSPRVFPRGPREPALQVRGGRGRLLRGGAGWSEAPRVLCPEDWCDLVRRGNKGVALEERCTGVSLFSVLLPTLTGCLGGIMCRKQRGHVRRWIWSALGEADSRWPQIRNAAQRPPGGLLHRGRQLQRPRGAHRYVLKRGGGSCLVDELAWLTTVVQPLDRAGRVHMLSSCRAWAAPHALTRALRREPLSKRPQPQQRLVEPFQE